MAMASNDADEITKLVAAASEAFEQEQRLMNRGKQRKQAEPELATPAPKPIAPVAAPRPDFPPLDIPQD